MKTSVKIRLLILFTALVGGGCLPAQDIHFSQFYASPLTLNPANTGNFDGDWRVTNNYRRQWGSIGEPFQTISLGYDQQLYFMNQRFSVGGIVVNDQSGPANLTATKLLFSLSWHTAIDGHNLHVGIQPGYARKSFDISKLTFPSQWDMETGTVNPDLAANETATGDQIDYFDLNFGASWSRKIGGIEPFGGIAFYHLNRPNESFAQMDNKLPIKKVLSGGAIFDLTDTLFMMPHLLFMGHTKVSDMVLGSNVGYRVRENKYKAEYVYAGVLFRSGFNRNVDAVIGVAGIKFERFDVGLSYDVNVSGLTAATKGRGGLELSIIYTAKSTVLKKTTIPCERL